MTTDDAPSTAAAHWPAHVATAPRSDRAPHRPHDPPCAVVGCLTDTDGRCTYCGEPT